MAVVGRIVDNLTFAYNLEKMRQKDMKEAREQAKMQEKQNAANNSDIDINSDENQSGTTHLNEPLEEESELQRLTMELQEMKDKYLRKVAEFDNYKKRNVRERMELIQTAGKEVITDLLGVLDDCERAEKQMSSTENAEQLKEGVLLVFNKLRNILTAKGLRPMESLNKDFNPDLHEAITEIPATSEKLKGKVVDEIEKGYYLNDKIIRHAKVVVGK